MKAVEKDQEELKLCTGRLLMAVQAGDLGHSEWQKLQILMRALASKLKDTSLVPKALLKELRFTSKVLRAEAAYHDDEQRLLRMADELDLTLDLILSSEEHTDRVPGVPRVM